MKKISLLICLLFFSIYSIQSVKLYSTHKTRGDLSNFAQAMWNSSQGRLMQNTFNYSIHNFWGDPTTNIPIDSNIFGIHFNPILIFFIPIYKAFPTPITLLIIQAFFVALSGYLIFLLSQSFFWQMSFLSYFALISAVLSEFHAVTLAIFFGLLLIYANLKFKNYTFFLLLIIFLFIQENTALAAFAFCFILIFSKKNRLKGIIGSIFSLIYFFLTTKVFIPYLSNYHGYIFESIYGCPLGDSFLSIALNSIKNPFLLLKTIFTIDNIKYLSKIYFPVFPFFIFSPFLFLASLSGLASNILSTSTLLKSISMHYEAIAIPFIFYSGIVGSKRLFKNKPIIIFLILITTTLISYKLFISQKLNRHVLVQKLYSNYDKKLDTIIKMIPNNASVSTQDYISGHLTNRRELYLFPVYYDKVDYILINNNDNTWPVETKIQKKYIKELSTNPKYKIVYQDLDFILFAGTPTTTL